MTLSDSDEIYQSIDNIDYRDYKGKFVVFFKKERAGRLFDFYEGKEKKYTFDFGEDFGGIISTDNIFDIDSTLMSVFSQRVALLSSLYKKGKTTA